MLKYDRQLVSSKRKGNMNTYVKKSANSHTPALLTNMSSRPNFSTDFAINSCPVSGFLMSPGTPMILLPASPASATRLSNCAADLSSG